VAGLQNEVTADDASIRALLPTELTPYRSAIERALDGHGDGPSTAERAASKLERTTVGRTERRPTR
jgi:hypothetical protein